jgi:hypothetical protein
MMGTNFYQRVGMGTQLYVQLRRTLQDVKEASFAALKFTVVFLIFHASFM